MLGYLNSALVYFHLQKRGKRKGQVIEYYKRPLEEIPIHTSLFDQPYLSRMEELVDEILRLKSSKSGADTRGLERQIDDCIFEIFGLTDEEVTIVRQE